MPHLTAAQVHVDAPLTDISVAFLQAADNYLAARVFPVVPVAKQSDVIFRHSPGDLLRDEAEIRAPGAESAGSAVSIDHTLQYYCANYSLHEDVADQIAANADHPLAPKKDAAENVTQKLITKSEVVWATNFFRSGVWTTDWTGAVGGTPGTAAPLWWGNANANPCLDIDVAIQTIQGLTGYLANTVVLSPDVFYVCKNHPNVIDRIKYTIPWAQFTGAHATAEMLAALWGVKRVLVAWAVRNTSGEGVATAISNLFTNGVFVCYAADAPGIRKPSAGYTFAWNGYIGSTGGYQGGSPSGGGVGPAVPYIRMKQYRMEHLDSDRVEGDMPIDHRQVSADLGLFIDHVLS